MNLFKIAQSETGLSDGEIAGLLKTALSGCALHRVLIIPPDYTRYHSYAGFITNTCYHLLTERGCAVDILPALGSHAPMTPAQIRDMYGDIPQERFLIHRWRQDVARLGVIPGDYLSEITGKLWTEPIEAQINRRVLDPAYDLILSVGQVVPHEVVGMSNHAKNLFVGVGGSDMINKSHMVGAVYGMERMMGRDHTPVRKIFDYGLKTFLSSLPIVFVLTVTTAPQDKTRVHGLFIGDERTCLTDAVALSQKKNIDWLQRGLKTCLVYLDPREFQSTWLGNKAIYRTRMAMADGGELIVLAPGVAKFGEDPAVDRLIRKYGYRGRLQVLRLFREQDDLRENMSAAAHLIHGSSDGRFRITYAVPASFRQEIAAAGYTPASCEEVSHRLCLRSLHAGFNRLPDGNELYFIPNPALGLWINQEKFGRN